MLKRREKLIFRKQDIVVNIVIVYFSKSSCFIFYFTHSILETRFNQILRILYQCTSASSFFLDKKGVFLKKITMEVMYYMEVMCKNFQVIELFSFFVIGNRPFSKKQFPKESWIKLMFTWKRVWNVYTSNWKVYFLNLDSLQK